MQYFFEFSMCCQRNISRQSRKFIRLECSKYLYQGQGQNCCTRKRTGTLGHNNFNFSSSESSDPSHRNANNALFHPDELGLWHQDKRYLPRNPDAQHSKVIFMIILRISLSRVKSGIQLGWHLQNFGAKALCLPKAKA